MPQYKESYMNHSKLLKKTIFIAKSNYYSNKLNLSNGDTKSTWKTLNHVIKPNRKFPTIKLEADNTVLTDPTEIASKFNEYFSHVTDELMNSIPPTTISPLANMSRLCNFFTYFETNSQEVNKLIKGFDQKNCFLTDFHEIWYLYAKLDRETFFFV